MKFDRMDKAAAEAIRQGKLHSWLQDHGEAEAELRDALSDLRFQAEVDAIRPRAKLTVEQTNEFCRLVREGKVQE